MIGRRNRILPTLTVTQYRPDHTAAHAYAVSSIHFINAPPWTLPPKLTEVGSARKRKVVSDRSGLIAPAVDWRAGATFGAAESVMAKWGEPGNWSCRIIRGTKTRHKRGTKSCPQRRLAYLRTDTPWSITPYIVMPLDPPADDDDPDAPAQPAHTTTSSVTTMIFNICILDTTAPSGESPF